MYAYPTLFSDWMSEAATKPGLSLELVVALDFRQC